MMKSIVVVSGRYPHQRKMSCCDEFARVGQSVLIVEKHYGSALVSLLLHQKCLAAALRQMPLDADAYETQFEAIRTSYLEGDDVKGATTRV